MSYVLSDLFWLVAVSVCGLFGLWPFRFVAVSVCGRFGLWPFWFVAFLVCGISVVAVTVCGCYDLLPYKKTHNKNLNFAVAEPIMQLISNYMSITQTGILADLAEFVNVGSFQIPNCGVLCADWIPYHLEMMIVLMEFVLRNVCRVIISNVRFSLETFRRTLPAMHYMCNTSWSQFTYRIIFTCRVQLKFARE